MWWGDTHFVSVEDLRQSNTAFVLSDTITTTTTIGAAYRKKSFNYIQSQDIFRRATYWQRHLFIIQILLLYGCSKVVFCFYFYRICCLWNRFYWFSRATTQLCMCLFVCMTSYVFVIRFSKYLIYTYVYPSLDLDLDFFGILSVRISIPLLFICCDPSIWFHEHTPKNDLYKLISCGE